LFVHEIRLAASLAACTAGSSSAIKTAMIAITTNNSISVKPRRLCISFSLCADTTITPGAMIMAPTHDCRWQVTRLKWYAAKLRNSAKDWAYSLGHRGSFAKLRPDTIMAHSPKLDNKVRTFRLELGWPQSELARRAELSRAEISAIETGRLVPSTSAALALARALGSTVEELFRLPGHNDLKSINPWVCAPPGASCRYWRAQVGGRAHLYPVEVSGLGLLPHDGTFRDQTLHPHPGDESSRTLVLATCDPAVGLLHAELERTAGIRLIVLPRSSRAALDLLRQGLVHAAGVHMVRSDQEESNAAAVVSHLAEGIERRYQLLRVAEWEEGIALAPSLGIRTIRSAMGAPLRWVARENGSAARDCLNELIGTSLGRKSRQPLPEARSHRGVADAIRGDWADAGVCLKLASEELGLSFLSVRREPYEICFADSAADDPRLVALANVVRSSNYRRLLSELPGYEVSKTGELRHLEAPGK
jgi:molybdate-binding protein/DNA-binding XRE family transcriptional regulator